MSIFRKPLEALSIADLEDLVAKEARETAELEFKGTLPFRPTKGQPAVADPWIEGGARIGNHARDEILSELVAFANAEGGTLVLGVIESEDEPRRAVGLEALPNCEALAKRLIDAAEDTMEPRLPIIESRALPVDQNGAGYVLLRVGKSLLAPHRLSTTREFYVRRGERASRMTVREIRDLTLDIARTADRVDQAFAERGALAERLFRQLDQASKEGPVGALVVRSTVVPLIPQTIPNLTRRKELWWLATEFEAAIDGRPISCDFPVSEFYRTPRLGLRALESPFQEQRRTARLLNAGGLAEFGLVWSARAETGTHQSPKTLPRSTPLGSSDSLLPDCAKRSISGIIWPGTPSHLGWSWRYGAARPSKCDGPNVGGANRTLFPQYRCDCLATRLAVGTSSMISSIFLSLI